MEWKPVLDAESLYEVSEYGDVRTIGGRQLKPEVNAAGYLFYTLTCRGVSRRVRAHRLVLEAFSGPPPQGALGLHYDDVPTHNHISNLRWGTPAENAADYVRNNGGFENLRREPVDLKRKRRVKTHCKNGHEFTELNTLTTLRDGGLVRVCRACKSELKRAYRARKGRRAS